MYICMCMFICCMIRDNDILKCIYACACSYVYTQVYIYTFMHVYTCLLLPVRACTTAVMVILQVHISTFVYEYTDECVFSCVRVYMYVRARGAPWPMWACRTAVMVIVQVYVSTCVYEYIDVCVFPCVYVCTCASTRRHGRCGHAGLLSW